MKEEINKKEEVFPFAFSQGIAVLMIGLGTGWLSGLSVSPVITGIITSLLGIGSGLVVGLQSVMQDKSENDNRIKRLNAIPGALLVCGLAAGATLGMVSRTHHFFEPGRGIRKDSVGVSALHAGEQAYYSATTVETPYKGVLFAAQEGECGRLIGYMDAGNETVFIEELKHSKLPGAQELVTEFSGDPVAIKKALTVICRNYILHEDNNSSK